MFSHKVLVMYFPQSTPEPINVHQKDIICATWTVTMQHSPGCPLTTLSWLKLSVIFTRNKGRGRPAHSEPGGGIFESGLRWPQGGVGRAGSSQAPQAAQPAASGPARAYGPRAASGRAQDHRCFFQRGLGTRRPKRTGFRGGAGDISRRKKQNKNQNQKFHTVYKGNYDFQNHFEGRWWNLKELESP